MTDQFPDATKMVPVPPPELVARWKDHWFDTKIKHINLEDYILAHAAKWGADQELEACCEWLERNYNYPRADHPLRTARRPEPVGPTDEDVTELFYRHMGEGSQIGFENAIAEVLARWGTPANNTREENLDG